MFGDSTLGRRSILKMMGAGPLLTAFRGDRLPTCEERLAVQAMRFVNTAQLWHKFEFGAYLDQEALGGSQVVARMHADARLEKVGLGKSLTANITLRDEEIFDGWVLRLRTVRSDDKGEPSYVALIGPRPGRKGRVYVSNQRGLIYEGLLRGSAQPRILPASISDMDWERLAPIGHPSGGRGWVGAVASSLVTWYTASCEDAMSCFDCVGCGCECGSAFPSCCCCYFGGSVVCLTNPQPGCCDVGCASCFWCCCLG